MLNWLRLVRWKNLLIILVTQFLVWWCVILPWSPQALNPVNFCFLSASTLVIAAAGYAINDYFDIRIDIINKPGKVVLEKAIPRKHAMIAHVALNAAGVLLAARVAVAAHHISLLLLQLLSVALLWYYSTTLKRTFIMGNLAVSLLTSLTVLTLVFYEPAMRLHLSGPAMYGLLSGAMAVNPLILLAGYAAFAFLLTWIREIVKDMEDLKGDAEEGCRTLPVLWGFQGALRFIWGIGIAAAGLLAACGWLLWLAGDIALSLYVLLLLVLLIVWLARLGGKMTSQHFHNSSSGLKMIMLAGLCTLLIYHFTA